MTEEQDRQTPDTFSGFTRADAAALRRGVDPWEVRGFYGLFAFFPDVNKAVLAIAAPILAEIREPQDLKLGKICKDKVSERRLRRLLESRDRSDLAHQLSNIVRLVGRAADPREIVEIVQYWGVHQRRRIAQDYFE